MLRTYTLAQHFAFSFRNRGKIDHICAEGRRTKDRSGSSDAGDGDYKSGQEQPKHGNWDCRCSADVCPDCDPRRLRSWCLERTSQDDG